MHCPVTALHSYHDHNSKGLFCLFVCFVKTTLVSLWSFLTCCTGLIQSLLVWTVHLNELRDGANGAGTWAGHGLPPLQLSGGHPPLDALQVQASIKQSSTERDADERKDYMMIFTRV